MSFSYKLDNLLEDASKWFQMGITPLNYVGYKMVFLLNLTKKKQRISSDIAAVALILIF